MVVDILRFIGIGCNEFIDIMNKCCVKVKLFRFSYWIMYFFGFYIVYIFNEMFILFSDLY